MFMYGFQSTYMQIHAAKRQHKTPFHHHFQRALLLTPNEARVLTGDGPPLFSWNMRVPADSSPHPKLILSRNIRFPTHSGIITNLCHEPTSVLDLRRSPSPVTDIPPSNHDTSAAASALSLGEEPHLEWDEHALHDLDWDSIMRDLGLHDDSVPASKNNSASDADQNQQELLQSQPFDPPPAFHPDLNLHDLYVTHNFTSSDNVRHGGGNCNIGFEFIEDVIRAAGCFDSNELQLAHSILDRLNQRLQFSAVKPIQRAAFYFKEALQSLLSSSNRPARLSCWSEIVNTIKAYKAFSAISPIPMFSHFTTNQALLEALSGSSFIHIIDFDIGLGGQYASFMKEISEKAESRKISPPVLRITAIVPEEYVVESRLIRENLCQFAQDLKIRFVIDFVLLRTFETLSFKAIKFLDGEKAAILLTPTIFRRLSSTNGVAAFLSDVRKLSPCVVVFVDSEGWTDSGTGSFKRDIVDGLEFYSMMLESLDASEIRGDWIRKIETHVLRPKILSAVEGAGTRSSPVAREVFRRAGMRPVLLSQFADFQAECLLEEVQVRGFHVAKRQAELVLCWQNRALVATSAWRC